MIINQDMMVKEIIDTYPETLSIFLANGFGANTREELLEELGESLMLKTALKVKGINDALFMEMMIEKIKDNKNILPEEEESANKLNFIGYTYCPLKLTFREYFDEVLKKYMEETGDNEFGYYVPSGCGGEDPYENLWKAGNIDELPDIIASVGFGDFFRKEFVDKFVSKGYFEEVSYSNIHEEFKASGFIDPDGWYTIYSVFPLVFLVDTKKLGNLPVPAKWVDLLNPVYENNIIIGASYGDIHEDLLYYIYKEHGDEGITKLAANVKSGLHASQMAKIAGTNSSEGAAIYVIPWMFAKSSPRTDVTTIVWPGDGAVTTPTYLLVKEGADIKYAPFIDFLMGTEYGIRSANNYFPVLNGEVDNRLPEGATFKWLGWDYIKSHAMDEIKEHVIKVFNENWTNRTK